MWYIVEDMEKVEKHHVLYPRKLWNLYDNGHKLRTNNALIVPVSHAGHLAIHGELEQMPLLDNYTLDRVVGLFMPRYDSSLMMGTNYINNIQKFQVTIEEAIDHPKASRVARSVGWAAIEALDYQMNIIRKEE